MAVLRTGVLIFALTLLAATDGAAQPPSRIISVVPAVTEMLYGIGAGDLVVGVSSFDRYPAEVAEVAKVGGLVDPDVERVLSLRPDLVIVYGTQQEFREQLDRAGIESFAYQHGGLAAVTEMIRTVGAITGHHTGAEALASQIEQRLARVAERVSGRGRPRTLLVFDRQPSTLRGIYASGGVGFLHDMLETAGGVNVFADVARESVQMNMETLLTRAPDVIIELRYADELTEEEARQEEASWALLPTLPAVRRGRVHMLTGNAFVVPGPRIAGATERLARALHPDAFLGEP